jgi:hypothetical protein
MDDLANVDLELKRVEHRAAVIAYGEATNTLAEAWAAFARAVERATEAREALWEEAWCLIAAGGDPGPMPPPLTQTDEGRALLREARAQLGALR